MPPPPPLLAPSVSLKSTVLPLTVFFTDGTPAVGDGFLYWQSQRSVSIYIDPVVLKRVTILRALPSQVFSVHLKCRNAARHYSAVSLFCVLPNIKYTQYIKYRLRSTSLKVVTVHFVLYFWYYFLVLQNLWVSLLRVTQPVYITYSMQRHVHFPQMCPEQEQ